MATTRLGLNGAPRAQYGSFAGKTVIVLDGCLTATLTAYPLMGGTLTTEALLSATLAADGTLTTEI